MGGGGIDIFYDGHACCLLPWHSFSKNPGLMTKDPGAFLFGVPLWGSSLGSSFDGFLFTGGGDRHILRWTCMLFASLALLFKNSGLDDQRPRSVPLWGSSLGFLFGFLF